MKHKFLHLTALGLATCLALASCGAATNHNSQNSANSSTTTTTPHEITDHGKHSVTIPAKIQKVAFEQIPLLSTFLAFHDGKAPGLVASSKHLVNGMADTIVTKKAPEVLKVDTSFDDGGIPNAEALAAIKPDVVFNNAQNKKNSEIIDSVGLTRVGFSTMGAPTETYAQWLKLLEDVYGTPGKTDAKLKAGKKLVDDARERASKVAENQKKSVLIVMGAGQGTLRVAGGRNGWFTQSWADRMNFKNVTADVQQPVMQVNAEQITAWNPDIILVTGKGMSNMTAKEILQNKIKGMDLSKLKAVINKQVYTTQLGMWNWFTPNPDAPLVANWIGSKIYPELFKDLDLIKLIKEYYKLTYHWELSSSEAQKILDPDA